MQQIQEFFEGLGTMTFLIQFAQFSNLQTDGLEPLTATVGPVEFAMAVVVMVSFVVSGSIRIMRLWH